jgi:hypothetical protein
VSSRLLSELDRKIDDGNALDGVFRAQTGDTVGAPADCYDAAGAWLFRTDGTNCGCSDRVQSAGAVRVFHMWYKGLA